MSTSSKFARGGAWAWLLGSALWVFAAVPAQAQNWVTLNCQSCHGSTAPPRISSSVTDGSGSTTLGLGEAWMANETAALNHVHAQGAAGIANSSAMRNVTGPQFTEIYTYFLNLRDGGVGTVPAQSFGSQQVASPVQSGTYSFTVTNYRRDAVPYSYVIDSGSVPATSHPEDYSLQFQSVSGAGCTDSTIPAAPSVTSVSCTVNVRVTFRPGAVGARNANLKVHVDGTSPTSSDTAARFGTLSGTGFVPAALTVDTPTSSAAPRDFVSPVNIDSSSVTFTIGNSGSVAAGAITMGATPADFVRGGTCGTTVTSLGASPATCTVILTYRRNGAPITSAGTQTVTAASGSTISIFVRGKSPQLTVTPPPFPVTLVGHPQTVNVPITGTGTATTTTGNVASSSPAFTRTTACNNTAVFPCNLPVTFTAATAGDNQSTTLTVPYSGTNATGTLTASARVLTSNPAAAGLGTTIPNSTTQVFGITNPSGVATQISASLTGAANFTLTPTANNCGTSLAGGAACSLAVTFMPDSTTGVATDLSVAYGPIAGSPTQNLAVHITGSTTLAPVVRITTPAPSSPPTLTFPATLPAQTSQLYFDVDNIGNADLAISNVGLTGNVPPDFSIVGNTCGAGIVKNGPSCRITVGFTPSTQAARTAKVVITHNANPTTTDINLIGTTLLRPLITVSPLTLDFGLVIVNTDSSVLSSTVTNSGNIDLHLSTVSIAGTNPGDFTQVPSGGTDCASGATVTPTSSCSIAVKFRTAQLAARAASVTIVHDATGSPTGIALTGTGAAAPTADVQTNQTSLTFDPLVTGSTSATQAVTVRNSGSADLLFSRVAPTGADAASFIVAGTCAVGTPLAMNATCTVTVVFSASNPLGARDANLSIESNAVHPVVTIPLHGSVLAVPAPIVSFAPNPLPLGDRTVNGIYAPDVVRLTNTGNAALQIASIATTGAGFAGNSNCGATLAVGAGCDISLVFTPVAVGTAYTGQLAVTSNAAGSPHAVALSGRGVAEAVPVLAWRLPLASFAFGDSIVGSTTPPVRSVVLTNAGPGGARLNVLNTVGPQASSFSVTGTCIAGSLLLQGDSCQVDVAFVPGSAGAKQASLQVASTGTLPTEIVLTGNGLGGATPALQTLSTTLAFTSTHVGTQSLPLSVVLKSMGTAPTTIKALAVSGPYTIQASSCGTAPFVIVSGNNCTVTLQFLPAAAGPATGELTVTSDADPAVLKVALSGNGEKEADVSSGGCSIGGAEAPFDPLLLLLALAALAVLGWRERGRGTAPEGSL